MADLPTWYLIIVAIAGPFALYGLLFFKHPIEAWKEELEPYSLANLLKIVELAEAENIDLSDPLQFRIAMLRVSRNNPAPD